LLSGLPAATPNVNDVPANCERWAETAHSVAVVLGRRDGRGVVYIDFDNIVISRYDELHGDRALYNDRAGGVNPVPELAARLELAKVDLGAIIDYATVSVRPDPSAGTGSRHATCPASTTHCPV
jgi:hypothetical protein